MRGIRASTLLAVLLAAPGAAAPQAREIAVAFHGTEDEIAPLLEDLNEHGEERGFAFVRSPDRFQLRIAVKTSSRSALESMPITPRMRVLSSDLDGSSAVLTEDYALAFTLDPSGRAGIGRSAAAAVLTPDDELLFALDRSSRLTMGRALNALAEEIVEKLSEYEERIPSAPAPAPGPDRGSLPPEELPAIQIEPRTGALGTARFDLIARNASLGPLLTAVAHAAGLNLAMPSDITAPPITIEVRGATLGEILEIVLAPLNLEWSY